jgi:hypothetical protein
VDPDTIVGGIQQLHYSASYGHLLAVEGAYRLRAIPLTDISHRSLTHRQRTDAGGQTYTQKPSLRSQPAVLTTDTSGRLFYWVREEDKGGNLSYLLLRYELPAPWSSLPIVIHAVSDNGCLYARWYALQNSLHSSHGIREGYGLFLGLGALRWR